MSKRYQIISIIVIVLFIGFGLRLAYYTVIRISDQRQNMMGIEGVSVSGIYPHLAVFNENHATEKPGETGLGAVVPWGDNLYAITYSAHRPKGSSDKLYVINKKGEMEMHPLSIGGTPANRMIHNESHQLIIGPYFIKENGEVRVVPIEDMPGRLTATTRHLTDPVHKVYFYTMEEGLYEVDVNTLEVTELFKDGNMRTQPDVAGPLLPGYHGKGAYVSQDRLVVANNGEYKWQSTPESGCLAEWDGENWKVIERKQFTEVTGPGGLNGNKNSDDPIWSTGWDDKSLILKLRDQGEWFTYRLPKASFTYDGNHGWHTEWPRIRNIGQEKWLMTMHGMFWAFPPDFSKAQTSGIRPYSSYLKIIPDFARWRGMIVFGCDDASMFDNAFVGQPHSNFWFIKPDQLDDFGPKLGFGGPWINDQVQSYQTSDPFLVSGFDRFMLFAEHDSKEDIDLLVEHRILGSTEWETWKKISIKMGSGMTEIFANTDQTEWVRFSVNANIENLTAVLHLSPKSYPDSDDKLFASMREMGSSDIKAGFLRPDGGAGNLDIFSYSKTLGTLNAALKFEEAAMTEEKLVINEKLIPGDTPLSYDSASVIYTDQEGARWRLPWGSEDPDWSFVALPHRDIREVATERSLMNAGGIFYELPREISGGIAKIKPITTHNRMIVDFCSWRGMLAMTGSDPNARADSHYFVDKDKNFGVWLGTIDDLWKFGKPTGVGGPWKAARVKAGEVSDPYFMYGFDNKTLELSHDLDEEVTFEVLADFIGEGEFKLMHVIQVNSAEVKSVMFDEGFSAFWVRLRSTQDCIATGMFTYY